MIVFTAHPDDEAFTAGGTIYLNNHNVGETILICATRGEYGRASLGQEKSAEEIKQLRFEELEKAANELGIKEIHISDFPDRGLVKCKKELMEAWQPIVESVKPEVMLGFGKDGYTGHLDHIVVGSVASRLARGVEIPYYAFSLPGGKYHHSFENCLQKKRIYGSYVNKCSHRDPDIMVEVNSEIKYQILQIYKSQWPSLDPYNIFSREDAEHFLRYEYFVKY